MSDRDFVPTGKAALTTQPKRPYYSSASTDPVKRNLLDRLAARCKEGFFRRLLDD